MFFLSAIFKHPSSVLIDITIHSKYYNVSLVPCQQLKALFPILYAIFIRFLHFPCGYSISYLADLKIIPHKLESYHPFYKNFGILSIFY
jgi:hypothetical protein